MSHKSYTKWWIASKAQLEDVRIRDQIAQDNLKEIKSRSIANNLVGGLFARYSMVVQNLTACLDQYCQVKRRSVLISPKFLISLEPKTNHHAQIGGSRHHPFK